MFPSWVLIAIVGYISMAISQLLDKALLNIAFKEVKAFVFLIAALNVLAFGMIPFGVTLIDPILLLIATAGGALFILALIPFLSALQGDEASRVIPLVGGVVPIATLLGEVVFLGGRLSNLDYVAFALLVIGSIVLTISHTGSGKRSYSAIIKAVFGATLFAASFVITKYVFDHTTFINGFFWMRLGGILVAIGLFFLHDVRQGIKDFFTKNSKLVQSGYFATQALNGGGFVMQSYAISLASVSLVNALQGSQYLFILIFVAIAAKFKPGLLGEKITVAILVEKLAAVFIIIAGIAALAF
jgi:drug/metabolite transporter (DMT)-like permease